MREPAASESSPIDHDAVTRDATSEDAPAREPIVEGSLLAGRYRLVSLLGEGGMGAVWSAVDEQTGAKVAIKLLKRIADADAARRFRREARAALAIDHPNVVRVSALIELDDAPAIVMEHLEGESLGARLSREGSLSLSAFAKIVLPVIDALLAAHELGVVHRDLKPENIFIAHREAEAETVKLLDFGIAKLTALDGEAQRTTGLTKTGALLGTPSYMSPEQIFGEADLDHRADVWALGIITYECVTGVLPTDGNNVGQILKTILAGRVWPIRETAPGLPEDVVAIVDAMLRRDRTERLSDLRLVRAVFEAYLDAPNAPIRGAARRETAPTVAFDRRDGERDRDHPSTLGHSATVAELVLQPARSRAPKRRWALPALALVLAGGVAASAGLGLAKHDAAARRPATSSVIGATSASPLTEAGSVLACPILDARGVDEPSTWLGAAAADLACRRAQWMLGGSPARTRTPAELLDFPRAPAEGFASDPFGDPASKARSRTAARTNAQAVLDGSVERSKTGFHVELALSRARGELVGHGAGEDAALSGAVQAALDALAASGALPLASSTDADVKRALFFPDPASGLALEDLTTHPGSRAACATLSSRRESLGPAWPLLQSACGEPAATGTTPLDRSSPAALAFTTRARAVDGAPGADLEPVMDELAKAREQETSPLARAELALAEGEVAVGRGATERAHAAFRLALRENPRDPDAWQGLFDTSAQAWEVARASLLAGWAPALGAGWARLASQQREDLDARIRFGLRAQLMMPESADVTRALTKALIAAKRVDEARALVATATSDDPAHAMLAALVTAEADAASGAPWKALDEAERALVAYAKIDPNSASLVGFAWSLARALDESERFAAAVIPKLASIGPSDSWESVEAAVMLCGDASGALARTCFAKLDELGAERAFSKELLALIQGARAWSARDAAGAAAAWRPLLAGGGRSVLSDPFDAIGDRATAERADADRLKLATIGGVSFAAPRAAVRAAKAGDKKRARELAQAVIDAWSASERAIPAVARMRALVR